jgi:hypothetical protein
MSVIRPQVFISYSRIDEEEIQRVRADLINSRVECWVDTTNIQTGDRLSPVIEEAIRQSSLFFAYVTKAYLASRWCMKELEYALQAPGVTVAPYADSKVTLETVPAQLMDEMSFGVLRTDNYVRSLLELVGRAWASLQTVQRVVPAYDHILTGRAIFESAGYSRSDLIERTKQELMLAGPNLRSWLSDDDNKRGLIELVKKRRVRVTLILATYESLGSISPEGALHLRESAKDIREMFTTLDGVERKLMTAHFHVGASTLSAVFIDPRRPEGILVFSPRWAIQFLPQDRLTCVIDKTINAESLYNALYNSVLLMTQGDAKTVDQMLAGP